MSPEQFRPTADLFPDPALLLSREGVVVAANRAAATLLGADPTGRPLADLATTPPDAVADYLRQCAASGQPVAGRLDLRTPGGVLPCTGHGAAVPAGGAGQVLLRLARREDSAGLAQRVDELTEEVRRRREAEELLRVTLASIGDAVIATDPAGRVTFLNSVAEALTGWPAAAAAGRPLDEVFRIVNEQTRRPAENPALRAIRDGVIVGLANHTVLIARDGREAPIDDSAAPIRDAAGVAGAVLVFRDVTERRRAEAELRTSRRLLADVLDGTPAAIYAKDRSGRVLIANRLFAELVGRPGEDVVGRTDRELFAPGHLEQVLAADRKVYEAGGVMEFEEVVRRPDGARTYRTIKVPVEGVGLVGIRVDVTDERRAERDAKFLADASAALAGLVDDASTLQKVARLAVPYFADWCAVDMLDAGGVLRRVAVAHVDPAKVELARELHRRYPPDPNAPQGIPHVARTGRSELVSDITDEMVDAGVPDPERRRIIRELGLRSYMGVPLAVRGRVIGVATFITAESGRRYDGRDLAVAEDLAHRAAVAVENASLYQELREADRRKNEFMATLAHELRNPLAPIRNALEVMKQPTADPAAVRHVREIAERQVHYLTRLVDDLLEVSRIVRGRIELRRERVELREVLARAVEVARPALDAAAHELTVSLPGGPVWLEADPVRLAQVFANLLTNAAKYTDPGGHVRLTARAEGGQAVVSVADTGIGLTPDSLGAIFDLFVQLAPAGTRTQGGLGIGLTLVRRLVELHGGTVEAHSEGLGKGSEFVVRLPLLRPDGERGRGGEGETKAEGSVSPSPPPSGPVRRVLIVDDNADAAESLAMLLGLMGHEVRVAHDGPAALAAVRENPPEVVLLDIGMPGMDGYEVARRLRAAPGGRELLLVALTGWGQEEDRRRSREAGFDHHLVKPADPDTLMRLLAAAPRR